LGATINTAPWIVAGRLASAYLAVGGMKIVMSTKQLANNPTWRRSPTNYRPLR
jgi:hypothetical protein